MDLDCADKEFKRLQNFLKETPVKLPDDEWAEYRRRLATIKASKGYVDDSEFFEIVFEILEKSQSPEEREGNQRLVREIMEEILAKKRKK